MEADTVEKIALNGLQHPTHRLEFGLFDFYLFSSLKEVLCGQKFSTNEVRLQKIILQAFINNIKGHSKVSSRCEV